MVKIEGFQEAEVKKTLWASPVSLLWCFEIIYNLKLESFPKGTRLSNFINVSIS